ncbi:hypothetical protein RXV86_13570 [Alisedimentitalea sp. MJ-SS2]|uniref:hypothetical protein n=1 Tax=Aliisedimentitalea sp. MJ-SS2 TaxID=3049795 RepID=UPI0029128FE8|nr:hypothetical protein [Alisedimentitalea sp. MJ-SS2]MDU8928414.1 hypothetical protein [Alisedimentitalea sp. MJ-SS2]
MKKALLILPLAITVSACMKPIEITSKPVDFARTKSGNAQKVVKLDAAPVRAYTKNADNKRVEVSGASCTAKSDEFVARFQTPATVQFPRTKGKASPMTITCKANDKTGSTQITSRLAARYMSVTSGTHPGAALLVTLVAAAATHGVAQERDHWAYVMDPAAGVGVALE